MRAQVGPLRDSLKANRQGPARSPPTPRLSLSFPTARQPREVSLKQTGSGSFLTPQDKTKLGVPAEVSSPLSLDNGFTKSSASLDLPGATEPESPELGFGDLHLHPHPHPDHHAQNHRTRATGPRERCPHTHSPGTAHSGAPSEGPAPRAPTLPV